ncbi:Mannosylglucosylglycerate synthase [Thermoflexales bacterium]|nr:Mannosylglucosylglycerate synthase [Thermoflexales bacterium]
MHIALIHYSAPPVVGGVESVLAQHARLMTQAGHTVRIMAARGAPFSDQIPVIQLPLIDSRHTRVLAAKAALDRGELPADFEPLTAEITHALQGALADVDVLIAHNVCSLNKNLMLTAALQRLARPRKILWHHDLAWTTPRYQAELHAGYPWDLLRTAWGARHVVVSDLRQRELAKLMNVPLESIAVVPNGIDPAVFFKLSPITLSLLKQIELAPAAPILLLPVRLTPRKNIELALRTLAALRREMPEAILIVTGPLGAHNPANEAYFEKLKNLRAELNLGGAAIFLAELSDTYLPDEVIADFYRLADALFMPSREEGFGIPILEAAFSRLPVFCTDIAPLRALGREEATYFSPDDDPAQVAQLIVQRLQPDTTYQLATHVRRHFSWERIYLEHIAPLLEETK